MSRESLHTVAEGEEGNVRPLSPELFRASVLERLLEGIEKVTAGQNDLTVGQNNLDKRLNDRLTDVTDGQSDIRQRLGDLFEGQSELSRSHFELSRNQVEMQKDQINLLNRIESLEADRRVSKGVSTITNPDFSEPQPKVAEL